MSSRLSLVVICNFNRHFCLGRRSISAKHNTDNKNSSYSKSFSNTKKEELMKVINEAKQKLENVSYRALNYINAYISFSFILLFFVCLCWSRFKA